MKTGRPRKPTALKLVMGNPGKRVLPKNEPKPPVSRPSAPEWLLGQARDEWTRVVGRLADVGLMTDLDVGALAAYCQAYGRWVQAEQALERFAARDAQTHGIIIKTSNGNAVQNPLVGAANVAMHLMHRFAVEFGMTPSARSRLDVDVGSADAAGETGPTGTARFF